jgi:hypothetical protein
MAGDKKKRTTKAQAKGLRDPKAVAARKKGAPPNSKRKGK